MCVYIYIQTDVHLSTISERLTCVGPRSSAPPLIWDAFKSAGHSAPSLRVQEPRHEVICPKPQLRFLRQKPSMPYVLGTSCPSRVVSQATGAALPFEEKGLQPQGGPCRILSGPRFASLVDLGAQLFEPFASDSLPSTHAFLRFGIL